MFRGLEDGRSTDRPPSDPTADEIADAEASQAPEYSGHVYTCSTVAWAKGPLGQVPTPGTSATHALFGALHAAGRVFHLADHDRMSAIHFVAFLEQLVATYVIGPLFPAQDNIKTHDAKIACACLKANPRAQILRLPKCAAHGFNPIERVQA